MRVEMLASYRIFGLDVSLRLDRVRILGGGVGVGVDLAVPSAASDLLFRSRDAVPTRLQSHGIGTIASLFFFHLVCRSFVSRSLGFRLLFPLLNGLSWC